MVHVATNGDVVLVVGPEKTRILTQWSLLKQASQPFAALLTPSTSGPELIESNDIRRIEVLLPDDDATAMKYICARIHNVHGMIPRILPAEEVLQTALAAHKYGVIPQCNVIFGHWLYARDKEPEDFMLLAAAAWVVQDHLALVHIFMALMQDYCGFYIDLLTQEVQDVLGCIVFHILDDQRDPMVETVLQGTASVMNGSSPDDCLILQLAKLAAEAVTQCF
ncbi:hypothetical protein BJX99DRAFT_258680 [Aspergillus californicus]